MNRPSWESYFMQIALDVARRSNCSRRHFGAVIVGPNREIVATGYNGTPAQTTNCAEGGCPRCGDDTPPGTGFDVCLCVHAEENAMLLSPRARLNGHAMYVTGRPCIICLRHIVTKRINLVYYLDGRFDSPYSHDVEAAYQRLVREGGITLLPMPQDESLTWTG